MLLSLQSNSMCSKLSGKFETAVFGRTHQSCLVSAAQRCRTNLSAMIHEAKCKRTFPCAGRLSTKQRLRMDLDQVSASAVSTAGKVIFEMLAIKKSTRVSFNAKGIRISWFFIIFSRLPVVLVSL